MGGLRKGERVRIFSHISVFEKSCLLNQDMPIKPIERLILTYKKTKKSNPKKNNVREDIKTDTR